ncbi:TetR/AcrR family transcriptional regulator [Mycolicibacterium parafortuitum]|uniref:Putative transcriptional regulatory protein [Mycobacterium tuberculosis H37Rv] n=1 Tax=Mycolicibacterium parafortuitum TaxID=39692 RepID=A0A375YQL1_MYCPF|nr:TetR family transcriptional regulator [Mycolicibacterium parafortuitum]ORB26597.1 TetR family transcriptional regulator [Mycolicibacterium parafortuitum]SRX83458.1 putative transcriptional regulatory protein [Mycobacterium tuberculosis H37Rv] [Mycolicibacterium parafortuitum]
MRSVDDLTATARIRDAAIDLFGRDGFSVSVRAIAAAADVSPGLVIHHFGSKEGLRKACDTFIAETVLASKQESIRSSDPATWFAAMAEIEDYAPMMAYLVRSMQNGGELSKMLWRTMIENTELYIEEGVRAGTIKPSVDPEARARFLALAGGGGFLLYLQLHESTDLKVVLHDYAEQMILPALELYTQGLMADSTMYDAFAAQRARGVPFTAAPGAQDG